MRGVVKAPLQRRAGLPAEPMDRSFGTVSGKMERTLRHMLPALPKDGATPLINCNVMIANHGLSHRTSMRLDVTSWLLLDHIAELEGYANRDVLVSTVHERFAACDLPLTAMVRLFLQTYMAPDAVLEFLGQTPRPYGRGFAAGRGEPAWPTRAE
ncbi:ribbon-helix-helix domain-containing protein [Azospirillum endophyticum]